MDISLESIRYPIGHFESQPFSEEKRTQWLTDLESLPLILELAISNLDAAQLMTPYREGGWTIHQVIHHVADSHINGYVRCKLGLTEQNPIIKTYEEKQWALLEDAQSPTVPVNVSLTLLHALHLRWVKVMGALKGADWERTVHFPTGSTRTLWDLLGNYSWHGRHHTAHITGLRERKGW